MIHFDCAVEMFIVNENAILKRKKFIRQSQIKPVAFVARYCRQNTKLYYSTLVRCGGGAGMAFCQNFSLLFVECNSKTNWCDTLSH